jgi:hypothetical protein
MNDEVLFDFPVAILLAICLFLVIPLLSQNYAKYLKNEMIKKMKKFGEVYVNQKKLIWLQREMNA